MKRAKNILFIIATVLMAVLTLVTVILFSWSNARNYATQFLFGWDPERVEAGTRTFYTTRFDTKEEAYAHSRLVAEAVQAEGTVLLKNGGVLPLEAGERAVSVFGTGSVHIAYGGTGSGQGNDESRTDLYTALAAAGFRTNPVLKAFYEQKYREGFRRGPGTDMNGAYYGMKGTRNYGYSVNEVPRDLYTPEVRSSYASYADAALVVISRSGGEGQDLPASMADFYEADGRHYLELTEEEEELLAEVKAGGFGKVVVLLNTLNVFECGFLDDPGIGAALWIGGPGQYGLNAVAKILTGEMSPGGRLPDTFAADLLSAPAMQNYGDNRYTEDGKPTTAAYVAYAEGIYVGYRYYETAAEEGFIDYDRAVVFPFGFGLGYTGFSWSGFRLEETDEGFSCFVTVENTGGRAGKDVVELFLSKPYDRGTPGAPEKAAVELVGFAKTGTLAPGESETVEIRVLRSALASYDTYGAGTYTAGAGTYVFRASKNAHEAVFTAEYTLEQEERMDVSPTGYEIRNRFETDAYTSLPEDVSLLSRADLAGTWPEVYGDGGTAGKAVKALTAEKKAAILSHDSLGADPVSGTPVTGSGEGLLFADVITEDGTPLPYDDPAWEKLVSCMTEDELYLLVSSGACRSPAIWSIRKQQSLTSDSPMGLHAGTLFPCYPIQAATWSTEAAEALGQCVAEEALWNGIRAWYAPAMDTHRIPFGGRNYEYYSEDGVLAGKYAAAVIRAARAGGLSVHIKHFALNDQDTNRGDRGNFRNGDPYNGLCTYASEQAIREIYLKPFEIAVTEGGANGVMTSYNRVGDTWAGGHYGLLTEVLRNEWGMRGNVLTDFAGSFGYVYMDMDQGLRAGNTQWLYVGEAFPIKDRTSDEAVLRMQKAAKDILYFEASSSRVNNQVRADGGPVRVGQGLQTWQVLWLAGYGVLAAGYVLLAVKQWRLRAD
ncbi:MAG: glycoside hydrolase family 3 C-terminal domain-containing protein [Lachnospiraceae bacterium]|nr:glycoside hydrolase family 3 C-terminal domain-containing protein [Lachnospiraceae bacterium]